ncbi:PP2C family protein-serine/threonine phosphatase [Streptomyces sp. NBC_00343]|uniref:PP2C family protein-serine/threonine phosphatase n=1 Tax=Streptomyces sp. NBC_00343 TaxID=2975719 RepID=UPI002E2D3862|nr:PP2C family protein-serine/threonine phosphatase [Streptomyces sp. NBC_00343]
MRHGDSGRSPLDRLPRAGDPDAIRRQHLLRVRGRSVAWIPPLLVLISILVVDWWTGGEFRTVSWIVLVPGIAAAICGVRGTAVFAVLGLATYVLADHAWPRQYQTGLPDFILVGVGGALAVLACVVRVRGERRMLRMRDVAETTRRTLLRPLPPGWGGLDHAAVYLAADAFARVGGDFYDIQPGPHGTRALVGDVQGKGLNAVEAAAALLGTFREAGYHERELATVAARLETRIHRHGLHLAALDREDDDRIDRFATAILLSFPVGEPDTVEVVNFGHEPPLVVGPHGVRSLPPGHGLPLGLGELARMDGPPPTLRISLARGETLLVVTDGVTEARDGAGVFYPLKSHVAEGVSADPGIAEPSRLVAYVRDGTLRHSGGHLADDTTVFAVRRS